ncbi:MAG: hypothetical protein COT91_03165 [Candidatus Doudnabacteria bacterium CG10_big_fil_rev_8_21_14_0_10_41_10]|uniref:Uncharacterized protein n=1 Tax=Candidatus Doudnabacteria bacterium CG10_big_fil_rev_8_21_14_0_10_41_10 TaxID=1974551 RepID=A0A2H0VD88_9BACT|nr:MAG: hypothetical protein COT91_03165 [Candidatus Doudnabacteria bacterium CG10_big_fil_rev_8_21_14_0_10_41_10]
MKFFIAIVVSSLFFCFISWHFAGELGGISSNIETKKQLNVAEARLFVWRHNGVQKSSPDIDSFVEDYFDSCYRLGHIVEDAEVKKVESPNGQKLLVKSRFRLVPEGGQYLIYFDFVRQEGYWALVEARSTNYQSFVSSVGP